MKVFMLVSRVPWPLEKGDKLRAYHQLRCLAKHHQVHLYCLSDVAVQAEAIRQLKLITPHVHVFRLNPLLIALRMVLAFFSSKPFQVHYFYQHWVARKIGRAIEALQPDHIYCQLVRCSEYVKHFHSYKKTIDYMDALSAGQQRRLLRAPWFMKPFVREEAKRLRGYEHLIFDYFEYHSIISRQDQQLIYHPGRERIQIIPNGIDADFFSADGSIVKKYDVVFTGNMSYPPNVEGAQRLVNDILPLILKVKPDARVLIAGANPSNTVRALASSHVEVSGWLDDIRDAYNESVIFVAPMLSGSGMQNKLLEAMCMQLPCVTTTLAANALGAKHGAELFIADSDEEISKQVVELLANAELVKSMGASAREFVAQGFQWDATVKLLTSPWHA